MWMENKSEGLAGATKIGWVEVKEKGKRLEYQDQVFRSLRGQGYKANYFDMETREEYWISGCRKDGRDALYNTEVEIDDDDLEKYWINIRHESGNIGKRKFRALGKY